MQDNMLIQWLLKRGITDSVLSQFGVTTTNHRLMGECIAIPVHNDAGDVSFNKYRRNPNEDGGAKYMYDSGSRAELYGWWQAKDSNRIIITEGELDALLAWSHNIPAVSSTGGCKTWREEWTQLLEGKQVIVCFDNDEAGSKAAAAMLFKIPSAAVVFIPKRPNIKDLTDYAIHGGNVAELMRNAVVFDSIEAVKDDRARRLSVFEDITFHDEYIRLLEPPRPPKSYSKPLDNTKMGRAKAYPIPDIIEVNRQNKALCPWHKEDTPSLHYYKKNNTVYCFACGAHGDAIDVYRAVHNCSFKVALNALT